MSGKRAKRIRRELKYRKQKGEDKQYYVNEQTGNIRGDVETRIYKDRKRDG